MKQYILAHDVGTSGNKAALYTQDGVLKDSFVCDYPTFYPQSGRVEQCAGDWWRAVCDSTRLLLERAAVTPGEIACVCFSAQMMGCLLVDKDGEPLRNSIIWADTRASRQEQDMLRAVENNACYRITGHRLSASYSAAKLLWVRDNEPDIYRKADKLLNAKDYLVYRLTGRLCTDYSDASGTNLLDITKKCWSQELVSAFEINPSLLPEALPSATVAGYVTAGAAKQCGLLEGTPVVLGGGDGSCACVGAGVVRPGKAYNVLGSSSWISAASFAPVFDPQMRTFNWVHLDENLYTPCGTMQAAGYSYAWFRDTLCSEEKLAAGGPGVYELIDRLVESSPPGARGVLFLPYLLGERSPLWDHNARGAFLGLDISSAKADMARAVLEGVGYNLRIIADILDHDAPFDEMVIIGGGAKGTAWRRILCDIFGKPLLIPRYLEEATSMGAAVCGGVGVGMYKDFSVADSFNSIREAIHPNEENARAYGRMYALFQAAYERLKPFYEQMARSVSG